MTTRRTSRCQRLVAPDRTMGRVRELLLDTPNAVKVCVRVGIKQVDAERFILGGYLAVSDLKRLREMYDRMDVIV